MLITAQGVRISSLPQCSSLSNDYVSCAMRKMILLILIPWQISTKPNKFYVIHIARYFICTKQDMFSISLLCRLSVFRICAGSTAFSKLEV